MAWEVSLPHKGVKEPRCGFAVHQLSAMYDFVMRCELAKAYPA